MQNLLVGSRHLKSLITLVIVLFAIASYFLPWFSVNNITALTMNAYDLAEWSSLHPSTPNGPPALLISLLLRIPLGCLLAICTIVLKNIIKCSSFHFFAIMLLVGGLLPPLDFFGSAVNDPNYGQQFVIAVCLLLIAVLFTVERFFTRALSAIDVLAAVAVISGLLGIRLVNDMLSVFKIPFQSELGAIIFPVIMVTAVFVSSIFRRKQNRVAKTTLL